MLNLASLLLGLSSWVLGLTAVSKRGSYSLSCGSFLLCGMAMLLQFFSISSRIDDCDWAGLMDTCPTLGWAACLLLAVTAALNLVAMTQKKKKG